MGKNFTVPHEQQQKADNKKIPIKAEIAFFRNQVD